MTTEVKAAALESATKSTDPILEFLDLLEALFAQPKVKTVENDFQLYQEAVADLKDDLQCTIDGESTPVVTAAMQDLLIDNIAAWPKHLQLTTIHTIVQSLYASIGASIQIEQVPA